MSINSIDLTPAYGAKQNLKNIENEGEHNSENLNAITFTSNKKKNSQRNGLARKEPILVDVTAIETVQGFEDSKIKETKYKVNNIVKPLRDIKFNRGEALLLDGTKFTGTIEDTLKNGEKIRLEYIDGTIRNSQIRGARTLEKTYEVFPQGQRRITTKRLFDGEEDKKSGINVNQNIGPADSSEKLINMFTCSDDKQLSIGYSGGVSRKTNNRFKTTRNVKNGTSCNFKGKNKVLLFKKPDNIASIRNSECNDDANNVTYLNGSNNTEKTTTSIPWGILPKRQNYTKGTSTENGNNAMFGMQSEIDDQSVALIANHWVVEDLSKKQLQDSKKFYKDFTT